MEALSAFLDGLTIWHWVGLGIVLLAIEVAVGTFDLLWVAAGAFLTALFALMAPLPVGGWQGQMVFFGVVAVGFVISGRTVFKGLRKRPTSHPNLNDRFANMVGQHGEAATAFVDQRGKVKVGDTVWLAMQSGEVAIRPGDRIVVVGADKGFLQVQSALG
jgi:hypothetical protein